MLTNSDKAKLGKAQQAALDALKAAGDKGLDSIQLQSIAGISATARLRELKELGHVIKKERMADNRLIYVYTYLGYSDSKQLTLFQSAA